MPGHFNIAASWHQLTPLEYRIKTQYKYCISIQ
nr:MAG TPA: hypothetical protein [Caudoviricetes sp.]